MEIIHIDKVTKPLLGRTEIEAVITFDKATPTRIQVLQSLASNLKAKQELLTVRKITTAFGEPKARVLANLYDSAEDMKKIESGVFLSRIDPNRKAAKGADAAPAK